MTLSSLLHLQEYLQQNQLDLAFIQEPSTIQFLTGYETEPMERVVALVVFPNQPSILFVPALEEEMAKAYIDADRLFSYLDHEQPWTILTEAISKFAPDAVLWGIEKHFISFGATELLKEHLPSIQIVKDIRPFIDQLRLIKTPLEIQLLKESGEMADLAMKIGVEALREGISEIEVVAIIEFEMKKRGIHQMSFDTMVLFGDHASDPHGVPGHRKLQKNEFVLFDLGVMYKGYASDMTRTAFFGDEMDPNLHRIHQIVQEAHDLAIQSARPGMTAEELDAIARNHIASHGYGEYFVHRLGHGIGQSCHEFPSLMEGNRLILQEGMCFSVEPGIYIPGTIGVRVEDCMVMKKHGCELFTHSPQFLPQN